MDTTLNLPSYEELFGELDFKTGDDARAVYSPAAYLVDLLQLLDDKFTTLTLDQRRPDIKQDLLLDGENTFTEMPYLDIVNTVLAKQIGDEADETLRTARYPFALPVHLAYEQVKTLLGHADKKVADLYTLFAQQPDSNEVARTFLGLSHEAYTLVTTTPANGSALYADYGNNQAPDPTAGESAGDISSVQFFKDIGLIAAETNSDQPAEPKIEQFLKITGLTGSRLRELLQQNLSSDEQTQGLAASFFINHNLHGYVRLTDDETALCWSEAASPIPWQWFERVNRFVRLAQWIGFSFTELDLILRDCCGNQLDAAALRTIAVVKQLRDRYELPVDRLCSLFAPINTVGMGDEKTPHDLFHRIFNVRWTPIDHTYLLPWDSKDSANHPLPPFLKDCTRLTCNGDILSLNGKPYRLRVAKALGMTDADITAVVTRFRTKYADLPTYPLHPETDWSNHELSLLHRLTTLAEMLDSTPSELLAILDLLETDPALRKENSFGLLIPTSGEAGEPPRDGYRSLAEGTVANRVWVVQTICALTIWMQENDFTAAELKQITNGQPQDVTAQREQQKQKIEALTNLYQQCKPLLLTADLFVSERFDARAARVIHRTVVESDAGLTAKADPRLLRFAAAPATAVAQQALRQLSTISAADFT